TWAMVLLFFNHSELQFGPFILRVGVVSLVSSAIINVIGLSSVQTKDPYYWKEKAKYTNPISLPFTVIYFSLKGIWWLIKKVPAAITLARRLTWTLFILVHSRRRTICFVDAGIGTLIGYFAGNALIGAVAGGFIGL